MKKLLSVFLILFFIVGCNQEKQIDTVISDTNIVKEQRNSFIKDSRVDYQRNLSTLSSNYHHPCDQFCEEVIELISKHIEEE